MLGQTDIGMICTAPVLKIMERNLLLKVGICGLNIAGVVQEDKHAKNNFADV